MKIIAGLTAAVAAVLLLSGCEKLQERYRAAEGVHDLLAAVQSGDRAAFDAHVDRPALRSSLRQRLGGTLGEDAGSRIIGDLLGSRSADAAIDQMVTPESLRILWRASGLPVDRVPTAVEIAPLMTLHGPGKACVRKALKSDQCVLEFADEDGVWKLVGIDAGFQLGPIRIG